MVSVAGESTSEKSFQDNAIKNGIFWIFTQIAAAKEHNLKKAQLTSDVYVSMAVNLYYCCAKGFDK